MNKLHFHPSRLIRTLVTVAIWIVAAFTMSGCATTPKPLPQIEKTEQHGSHNKLLASSLNETSKQNTSIIKKAASEAENSGISTLKPTKKPAPISIYQKKKQFFSLIKPLVVAENKVILKQRQQILQLQRKKHLPSNDIIKLQHIAQAYGLKFPTTPHRQDWQNLLSHVDIVPVALALVQAANESAWGTSFFAQQGNNYFGHWCYQKGCGIVPRQRTAGASHEVKRFKSARESVQAYMKNINSSRAYSKLRKIRHQLRKRHLPIHAETLTQGLMKYSERGAAYVKTLRTMIRTNRKLIDQANSG